VKGASLLGDVPWNTLAPAGRAVAAETLPADQAPESGPAKPRRRLFRLAALCLSSGCALLFADWVVLAGAGFPSEPEPQATHPANYVEQRRNIEFAYEFRTNSQGLRSAELPLEKPPGERRLLVLGDSFTEGYGVAAEATFCSLLDSRYSGVGLRVINGGLAGAGPLQYARFLERVGLRYDPDAVLVCLYANDVANTPDLGNPADIAKPRPPVRTGLRWLLHGALPRTYTLARRLRPNSTPEKTLGFVELVSERARSRSIPEAQIERWVASLGPYSELIAATERDELNGSILSTGLLYPDYWADSIDVETPRAQRKLAGMLELLEGMRRLASARGVPFAVAYLPSPHQSDASRPGHATFRATGVTLHERWTRGEQEIQRRLRAWASAEGIPLLDLTESFRALSREAPKDEVFFPFDGHWTPRGHRYAEGFLHEWLVSGSGLREPLGLPGE
jgi:GDSL-like lipase/acylhydrolase family protein